MGHAELQPDSQPQHYTPEEYFVLEASSNVRHEYFDGEVFAMAGTSKTHNRLSRSFDRALTAALRGGPCESFTENVQVVIRERFHYYYPDVVVSCHEEDRRDEYRIRHPLLIVEVLSPGTESYDRNEKFKQCQRLASLRHYVLVHQAKWCVEWFRRNDAGEWVIELLNEPTDALVIADLHLHLSLADLYADTGVAPLRVSPPPPEALP